MITKARVSSDVDVVVVGAGFSGLHLIHTLREKGFTVRVFERGDGVGGTWYWNRYPGARCDAESIHYSFSFSPEVEQEWTWTEKFATQPEILSYLEFVSDRLDLRRDITFETSVVRAAFDSSSNTWSVTTDKGETISARFVVMATGCLSAGRLPDINNIEDFAGATYHTGNWPHEGVDFTGLKVGVIGTGSSGIQAIPEIAKQALSLTVFQRTPSYSVPAQNAPLTEERIREVKSTYSDLRNQSRRSIAGAPIELSGQLALQVSEEERFDRYEKMWRDGGAAIMYAYDDIMVDNAANDTLAEFVRDKIDSIVTNPAVARLLKPSTAVGTKRLCVDTDYYATYNRENVTLVDLRSTPISRMTDRGIETSSKHYDLDVVVFATGYDAMTGALNNIDIVGASGVTLREEWSEGPKTYLGLAVRDFPNLFIVTGPGSPSVLSNVVISIEQHVEWITDHIEHLEKNGFIRSEAIASAQEEWVKHVNDVANATLYPHANSWYLGANIPGKPRVFMPYVGGVGNYRAKCEEVAANDYEGFVLSN